MQDLKTYNTSNTKQIYVLTLPNCVTQFFTLPVLSTSFYVIELSGSDRILDHLENIYYFVF